LNPEVTIIIATYNRPDVLKTAVKSVVYQTFPHWVLYVIGDCCDERTNTAVAPFEEDPRIYYINLRSRTGSQSFPNSVGMNLAQTPYIAYLNHDDIWLSDHLDVALNHLKNDSSNFFLGSSLVISGIDEKSSEKLNFSIKMKTSHRRTLADCFHNYLMFEPASSWVIDKKLAQKTGPWISPFEIYRFPSQDWLMRAWRAGASLSTDPRTTSIKLENHLIHKDQKGIYNSSSQVHSIIFNYLKKNNPQDIRDRIKNESSNYRSKTKKVEKKSKKFRMASLRKSILKLKVFSWLYYLLGIDIDKWLNVLYGKQTGSNWKKLLQKRTKETLTTPPDLEVLTAEAKQQLSKKIVANEH
jgi:glycosyltransferase involved in cell wall biosynthesis